MSKKQLLSAGLFISFFFGYLEWGNGNTAFVYEGFLEVISNAKRLESNFTHPLIVLPLIGQIIFLSGTFKKTLKNQWFVAALILTGLLFVMILLAGVLSMNLKIIISCLPYLLFASSMIRTILMERKKIRQ
jgi:hypothetical protein